jgi:hypothetical protein
VVVTNLVGFGFQRPKINTPPGSHDLATLGAGRNFLVFGLKFFLDLPMLPTVGVAATRHRHSYDNRKFGLLQGGNSVIFFHLLGYTKMKYKEFLTRLIR